MKMCLSQMDSSNEIFAKDYVAPRIRRGLDATIEVANLDELEGFFAGLPLSRD